MWTKTRKSRKASLTRMVKKKGVNKERTELFDDLKIEKEVNKRIFGIGQKRQCVKLRY